MPVELHAQSSSLPPNSPLYEYAGDVLRRCKQFILVIRDTFSSFTCTSLMSDEQHSTLRSFLIVMLSTLKPNPQSKALVRVDNAPGFRALRGDTTLTSHNIELDFGRVHNKNKNPVVEKGIRELGSEILRLHPEGGPISSEQLAVITNQLNSRIRNRGLSAWEILCQRNQFTGEQIDINDLALSEQQAQLRVANQEYSARSKARGNMPALETSVTKGSLVYIKSDGDKTRARDRYLVVAVDDGCCTVQKFVKSQLRSKQYQLKLTEVYPVPPDSIEIPGKICDLDPVGSEIEDEENTTSGTQTNLNPVLDHCVQYDLASVAEDGSKTVQEIQGGVDVDRSEGSGEVDSAVEVSCEESSGVYVSNLDSTGSEAPVEKTLPATVGSRRSNRTVVKPSWMLSGEYDLDG